MFVSILFPFERLLWNQMVVGKSALIGTLSASTEQDGERMGSTSHIVRYPSTAQLLSEVKALCTGFERGYYAHPVFDGE